MKVLVTGVSGRLGPFIVRELERAGHELVMSSRREPPAEILHWPWVQGDIAVYEDCLRMVQGRGIEAIQHAAAQPWPVDRPGSRERAEELGIPFDATMRSNIMGLYYLLQAALQEDVGIFVMTGSNCALGHGYRISERPFPMQYLPVDEEHPSDVEDSYSYSKLVGEELLASYTRAYGMRTYALRAAGICNEERRRTMAQNVKPVEAWSPWMWAWVGSEDVASAHRLLMERAGEIEPQPQPAEGVTYAPRLTKDDGRIDFGRPAAEVDRHVRAMTTWPGARTSLPDGRDLVVKVAGDNVRGWEKKEGPQGPRVEVTLLKAVRGSETITVHLGRRLSFVDDAAVDVEAPQVDVVGAHGVGRALELPGCGVCPGEGKVPGDVVLEDRRRLGIERLRPTEVDFLNGEIVRLAHERVGIAGHLDRPVVGVGQLGIADAAAEAEHLR